MTKTNEESGVFIDSIKRSGVSISNEHEVIERLAEAAQWRYALQTLLTNGKSIGIRFMKESRIRRDRLHKICERFGISERTEMALIDSLRSV